MEHPMLKICPMSQAATASKKKAKSSAGVETLFDLSLVHLIFM